MQLTAGGFFKMILRVSAMLLFVACLMRTAVAAAFSGTVIDGSTHRPLENAFVTLNHVVIKTDSNGRFNIDGPPDAIGFRAYGYSRQFVGASEFSNGPHEITLMPFQPKALYLSFYGIGSSKLREAALDLAEKTEINAVVIDVKGDRGGVAFQSAIPLVGKVGAQKLITIREAKALLDRLHEKRIYAIARIVVFKDDLLAMAHPDLAVKRSNGTIFKDRERLAWTDPSLRAVWDYNIGIAVEAAQLGFDEIQFDYVRFPDSPGLIFSVPNKMSNRLAAISGFLGEARRQLTPYNVFLAADVFGYVMWNLDDTNIGQRLEELSPVVDYISPMLYPSCFQFGIPGYRLPVANPRAIVFLSLQNARERTGIPSIRFRPWLQAFRDYAFDHRQFTGKEIRAQITAAEKFGSDGWMLWNPSNTYTAEGLKTEGSPCKQDIPQ
jgi:hypothetical protein